MWSRDTLRAILLWLLFAAACAASYVKSDLTTNDFERFGDLRLTISFFVISLGLCAAYLDAVGRSASPPPSPALRWGAWAAFLLPLLLMFPVGSKDVFAYSLHAKMWSAYGLNPYLEPSSALAGDDWLRFLKVWWADSPAPYGPLALEQGRLLYAFAGTTLPSMIAAFKLYDVVLLVPCAWLVADLAARAQGDERAGERAVLLWLWCPLVLFETAGNAHNDVTMVAAMLAAVALQLRRRWLLSLALLLVGFWYKWYSIVLLPVWLAWQWRMQRASLSARNLTLAAALGGGVSVLALAPFGGSLTALGERVFLHENIFRIFPTELPPPLWLLHWAGGRTGLLDRPFGNLLFDTVRFTLLAACLLWIVRRRTGIYTARAYVEDCFWSLLAFLSFGVTILWPWHLLAAVAFALASGERRLQWAATILTTLGLLSYFLTFTVAALMAAAIATALWALRRGSPALVAQRSR